MLDIVTATLPEIHLMVIGLMPARRVRRGVAVRLPGAHLCLRRLVHVATAGHAEGEVGRAGKGGGLISV